jgi:hypothetical protein
MSGFSNCTSRIFAFSSSLGIIVVRIFYKHKSRAFPSLTSSSESQTCCDAFIQKVNDNVSALIGIRRCSLKDKPEDRFIVRRDNPSSRRKI